MRSRRLDCVWLVGLAHELVYSVGGLHARLQKLTVEVKNASVRLVCGEGSWAASCATTVLLGGGRDAIKLELEALLALRPTKVVEAKRV